MDDKKIIELYLKRDEHAILATSKKYGKYCSAIAMNILGNSEDTEECVSDAYLKIWNSIPPNRPSTLSAFLGKITRNLAFNRCRYLMAEKRGSGRFNAVLDELEDCVSGSDMDEQLDMRELANAISDFLLTLPSRNRNIFVCRYWYADELDGIAKQFKISKENTSVILARTRAKLRTYLSERGFTL